MIESRRFEIGQVWPGRNRRNLRWRQSSKTCTNRSARRFPIRAAEGRLSCWGCWSAAARFALESIENRHKRFIEPPVHANIEAGAHVITDEFSTYPFVAKPFYHEVINHVEGYVRDHVHTNSIENFWSLLKRGLGGTYISVEPIHLDKYVDEQVFRFQ